MIASGGEWIKMFLRYIGLDKLRKTNSGLNIFIANSE